MNTEEDRTGIATEITDIGTKDHQDPLQTATKIMTPATPMQEAATQGQIAGGDTQRAAVEATKLLASAQKEPRREERACESPQKTPPTPTQEEARREESAGAGPQGTPAEPGQEDQLFVRVAEGRSAMPGPPAEPEPDEQLSVQVAER